MKRYKYEAIDRNGETIEGIVSAKKFEAVVFKILQSNLYPTRIEELTSNTLLSHGRLAKLKEIKRKLEPPDEQEIIAAPSLARDKNMLRKLFLLAIIALWLAMIAAYMTL
jgi:hypothetical protein